MSRIIKFRAWDKKKECFCGDNYRDYICISGDVVVLVKYFPDERGGRSPIYCKQLTWPEIDNLEIMQFTGLKDKNGKEIYEKDRVKFKCIREDVNVGIVEWNDRGAYFTIKAKLPLLLHRAEELEVIGNEFEN